MMSEIGNVRTSGAPYEEGERTEEMKSEPHQSTQSVQREQARAVFRRLPTTFKGDNDSSNELTISTVLRFFAEEGLLELEFLKSDATSVHPRDLRRVTEIMTYLAERSGTIASIYMVNAILAAAVAGSDAASLATAVDSHSRRLLVARREALYDGSINGRIDHCRGSGPRAGSWQASLWTVPGSAKLAGLGY
jgi:hypothetical protein